MSAVQTNWMDRQVDRKLLVLSFGIYGLITGFIMYFQPFSGTEWSSLFFNLNFPAVLAIFNLQAIVNNLTFGKVSLLSQFPPLVIAVSAASWALVGFILHVAFKFFTTTTELEKD